MGLMKENLMWKIIEFAQKIGTDEKTTYENDFLYDLAVLYAQRELDKALEKIRVALGIETSGI